MIDKETEEVLSEMAKLTKTPLIKMTTERKPILVIDINTITKDEKVRTATEFEKELSEKYDCNVLLVDYLRQNVQTDAIIPKPYFI